MRKLVIFAALLNCYTLSYGQDRSFTYTYESGVLNKGQKEIELWTTLSGGRANYYRGIEHRLEFETGLGGNLQTAFYLNCAYSKGIEAENGVQLLKSDLEYSFSNEWKYKMTDPIANTVGSALYFEYTLKSSSTELEGKFIVDKQIGQTIHAFNLVGEYAVFKEFIKNGNNIGTKSQSEWLIELNYSFACKIREGLSAGMELFNQNQFSAISEFENSILSLGPCISYNSSGFWVNLTFMPRVAILKGGDPELKDHEKLQTRLAFSYAF